MAKKINSFRAYFKYNMNTPEKRVCIYISYLKFLKSKENISVILEISSARFKMIMVVNPHTAHKGVDNEI